MFGWLLTKPAVILDLVLGGMLLAFGLYFWYANSEVNRLTKAVTLQAVQLQENQSVIQTLNDRLVLVQKLNDNFNKSIDIIQKNQNLSRDILDSYNLKAQAIKDPRKTELFINDRNHKIFDSLNNLDKVTGTITK